MQEEVAAHIHRLDPLVAENRELRNPYGSREL